MDLTYYSWLNLEVRNDYFRDGICSSINLVPLSNAVRQFKNYEIRLNKKSHAYSFYLGIKGKNIEQSDLLGLEPVYLQLQLEDKLFFSYTDIPFLCDGQIYYFDNKATTSSNLGMQIGEAVSEKDIITLKPNRFCIELPLKAAKIELKSAQGESITNQSIGANAPSPYMINMAGYNSGMYELWIDSKFIERFFMSDQELKNCMGIVAIDVQKVVNEKQHELSIVFSSRSVFCNYQVVVPPTRQIVVTEMKVQGGEQTTYQGPKQKQIIGGQTAQVFTAEQPIKLRRQPSEYSKLLVNYSNKFSNRINQLEVKLPNPDVETIRKYNQGENEGSFFSSTIVYV